MSLSAAELEHDGEHLLRVARGMAHNFAAFRRGTLLFWSKEQVRAAIAIATAALPATSLNRATLDDILEAVATRPARDPEQVLESYEPLAAWGNMNCRRRGEPGGPCWGSVAPYVRGNRIQGQHEVALCKGHVGIRWAPSTDKRDLPKLETA